MCLRRGSLGGGADGSDATGEIQESTKLHNRGTRVTQNQIGDSAHGGVELNPGKIVLGFQSVKLARWVRVRDLGAVPADRLANQI